MMSVTLPDAAGSSITNVPSVPDTALRSPSAVCAVIDAPATTAPDESWTTPEIVPLVRAARSDSTARVMALDCIRTENPERRADGGGLRAELLRFTFENAHGER